MAVRVLGPVTYGADSSTVVWVLAEGFVSCHVSLSAIIIPVLLVLQICLQQSVSPPHGPYLGGFAFPSVSRSPAREFVSERENFQRFARFVTRYMMSKFVKNLRARAEICAARFADVQKKMDGQAKTSARRCVAPPAPQRLVCRLML